MKEEQILVCEFNISFVVLRKTLIFFPRWFLMQSIPTPNFAWRLIAVTLSIFYKHVVMFLKELSSTLIVFISFYRVSYEIQG